MPRIIDEHVSSVREVTPKVECPRVLCDPNEVMKVRALHESQDEMQTPCLYLVALHTSITWLFPERKMPWCGALNTSLERTVLPTPPSTTLGEKNRGFTLVTSGYFARVAAPTRVCSSESSGCSY